MAQFDTNVPQTTGTINVPQPHAVENDSAANAISAFGSLALNTAGDVEKSAIAGKKLIGQSNLAAYSIQLGKLQNAVSQGTMSSAAARSRIRDLRNKVIANNPSLLPQIDSTTSSFLSDSGLGGDIVKGTQAEQQEADITSEMAKDGWNITPNMDETQKQDLIHAWQTQKQAQQQLQLSAAQLAVTRGKLGVQKDQQSLQIGAQNLSTGAITQKTDQINLDMKLHQQTANNAIYSGANAWTTNFATKINGIIHDYDNSGKTPADQQRATDQINLELSQITASASRAGIGGDQNIIDQAIAPMKSLASSATQFIQGKVETQGYKDAVDNAMNTAKLMALHAADPQSLKTIGLMSTSVNMSSALANVWGDRTATQILGKNSQDPSSQPPPKGADLAVGKDDPDYGSIDKYLTGIKTSISKSNSGGLDPQGEKLLGNQITNMANGLLNGNTKAKTASDYNRIMQFFADPAVNAYMVAHPHTSTLKGVNDMMAHEYTLNIQPLITEEWRQAAIPQGNIVTKGPQLSAFGSGPMGGAMLSPEYGYESTANPKTLVTPEFSGSGIIFHANDPKNAQAVVAATHLNEKVAPIMGRLIRATATLEGTSNYRKVWNETYAGWFDQPEESQSKPAPDTNANAAPAEQSLTLDKATPQLMKALVGVESNGDNSAESSKGAISKVQMLPTTAEALGYDPEELKKDPHLALQAGTKYLNMQLVRFDGNLKLALAAYNAGPTAVSALLKKHNATTYAEIEPYLPEETKDYVPKVLNRMSGGGSR